jgi:TolB-like protein
MSADESPTAIDLAHEAPFRIGALEVRPSTREMIAGERREVVEPRVMQVLVALARRRGEVVSRDDLIAAAWGGRVVGEDAINRAVAGVRRLAETYGGFRVETVARVGYRLGEAGPSQPSFWRKPRAGPWAWAVAALVFLAAAGSGSWLIHERFVAANAPARVAVLPFDAIGANPQARAFADGLLDDLVGALSANQVDAVSRSESLALRGPQAHERLMRLGAAYVLDGAVESDGTTLRVRVHLGDVRERLTLWSKDFSAPVGDAEALRAQVATRTIDVTHWLTLPGIRRARADAPTLAAYTDASDSMQNGGVDPAVAIVKYRQVVARAPSFSYGHSGLAFALLNSLPSLPAQARAKVLAQSLEEARTTLLLDPRNGEGYLLLEGLTPLWSWRVREDLLAKGLAVDPEPPILPMNQGSLLAQVGRTGEAVAVTKRAVAAEPYLGWAQRQLAYFLATAGRTEEAQSALAERWLGREVGEPRRPTEFLLAVQTAPGSRAIAMLDDPAMRALLGSAGAVDVERSSLRALASGGASDRNAAAGHMRAAVEAGAFPAPLAVSQLSALGDVDGAFAAANRAFTPETMGAPKSLTWGESIGTEVLFSPPAAAMRKDVRFMRLTARLGLVDYWRASGHWPDFCSEPGLPYDCKAEAARVVSAR